MTSKTFCSVPHALGRGGLGVCQWPRGMTVTWHVVAGVPGFSIQDLQQIYAAAFDLWSAVSGFRHEYTSNPRNANLIEGSRPIDRAGGILAEHQLPCGNIGRRSQLQGWFDSSDSWTTAKNWQGTGKFPIQAVAAHEFGHGIGISHNQDGVTNNLMDPTVSNINAPQSWDIEEAVTRYGPRPTNPDPTPNDSKDDLLDHILDCLNKLDRKDIDTIKELFF